MWDRKPAQSVNNPLGVLGDADQTIDGEMTIKARMLKAGVHAGTARRRWQKTYCVLSRGAELLTLKTAVVFNNIRHSTPEKKC